MAMTSEGTALEKSLQDFSDRFNTNERVKKLIKGWNRSVMLEGTDTGSRFSLLISDGALTDVKKGLVEWDPPIHLQAEEDVLRRMFTGVYNPASALMDGALAVYSHERDKVKLEAIAMVIWGVKR